MNGSEFNRLEFLKKDHLVGTSQQGRFIADDRARTAC